MKYYFKFLIVLILFCITGCQTFLDVGDNMVRSFSKPEKPRTFVKDPVKENVILSALWIGHASFLLQIHDKVIIIDPLLTNNVAAVLRRHYIPGIDLDNVSQCNLILISHSHMDHLSLASLDMLEDKFPSAHLVFPEGVEDYLPDYSFTFNKLKMAPSFNNQYIGETVIIDSIKITSIESVHWGGRFGIDGKLWTEKGHCAYIIEYKGVSIYYSGDSSYEKELFKFIKENYNLDLAIINIIYCDGCKEINQSKSHLYPMGAVKIYEETGAEFMIPAHFGTFTDVNKQIKVLKSMMHTDTGKKTKIKILNLGEQVILKKYN